MSVPPSRPTKLTNDEYAQILALGTASPRAYAARFGDPVGDDGPQVLRDAYSAAVMAWESTYRLRQFLAHGCEEVWRDAPTTFGLAEHVQAVANAHPLLAEGRRQHGQYRHAAGGLDAATAHEAATLALGNVIVVGMANAGLVPPPTLVTLPDDLGDSGLVAELRMEATLAAQALAGRKVTGGTSGPEEDERAFAARALFLIRDHPEWPVRMSCEELGGISHMRLYRHPIINQALKERKAGKSEYQTSGYRSTGGDLDAWHADEA